MAIDEALLRRQLEGLEGLEALNEWELQEKMRNERSH